MLALVKLLPIITNPRFSIEKKEKKIINVGIGHTHFLVVLQLNNENITGKMWYHHFKFIYSKYHQSLFIYERVNVYKKIMIYSS